MPSLTRLSKSLFKLFIGFNIIITRIKIKFTTHFHCPLPIAQYPIPNTQYPLPIAYCPLPITHYLLPIAHCLLPIAHCPLPIAHCLLPIAHCPSHTSATYTPHKQCAISQNQMPKNTGRNQQTTGL